MDDIEAAAIRDDDLDPDDPAVVPGRGLLADAQPSPGGCSFVLNPALGEIIVQVFRIEFDQLLFADEIRGEFSVCDEFTN